MGVGGVEGDALDGGWELPCEETFSGGDFPELHCVVCCARDEILRASCACVCACVYAWKKMIGLNRIKESEEGEFVCVCMNVYARSTSIVHTVPL